MKRDRFILEKSKEPNHYVCTDNVNGLVVIWKSKQFNETQKFTFLEDVELDVLKIAKVNNELTQWLIANHSEQLQ